MRLPVPIDTAVLLAAGRGTRLAPWTDRTPKALLPRRGRPTLDLILDALALAGIERVVLVVHHLAEQIESYASRRRATGDQKLICVRQEEPEGTAHALERVMYARPELLMTPFLASATDYLVPPRFYRDLLRFHSRHDAALTVSLKPLDEDGAGRSSVRFATERDGSEDFDDLAAPGAAEGIGTAPTWLPEAAALARHDILEIVEKPAPGEAPSAIGANLAFVLPPEVLRHVRATRPSARGEREIQSAINAWLAAGGTARGLLQRAPPEWRPPDGG